MYTCVGGSPLHDAVGKGHVNVLNILLNHSDCDINLKVIYIHIQHVHLFGVLTLYKEK